MRVFCVLTAEELGGQQADLIVFPGGVDRAEIEKAHLVLPRATIAGAVLEGRYVRAVLLHQGLNRIDYLKVDTDRRTEGTGYVPKRLPLFEAEDVCIGVLICMDVNLPDLASALIRAIRSSSAHLKIVCIPSHMGSHWFNADILPSQQYEGVHVVLCNHTKDYQDRCKSFVTDTRGKKIRVQQQEEPIHVDLR